MKVLLAEGYHDTRQLMRMFPEQQGCDVVEAAGGREAVAYAAGDGFDLVMMDFPQGLRRRPYSPSGEGA